MLIFGFPNKYCNYIEKKTKHKQWRNRRWWVRPLIQKNYLDEFSILIEEFKNDKEFFFHYTRMSLEIYNDLLKKIHISIIYITSRESVLSIALHYRVGESIRTIIIETCSVIIDILPIYLKQPKEEDWFRISSRWKILSKPIRMNVDKVERIIGACMPPQFHNIYAI
ncbi:LOW QUALITY PROTEIN: uncharacterized protein LOC112552345 [Pogonomyrmex barbatus]|uniref:LOW QUALITY PROTEIN: uncharacterized protein LOC112552345 n=1 Tax=Pogonomyrmex barbatus TaxID=144034 RepID=A0A8N1S511_9HYME|nr:LOW QUALITY PROTEIN: uncharacterized protein LOC112552345 [Pogonomyrmex barbatus]